MWSLCRNHNLTTTSLLPFTRQCPSTAANEHIYESRYVLPLIYSTSFTSSHFSLPGSTIHAMSNKPAPLTVFCRCPTPKRAGLVTDKRQRGWWYTRQILSIYDPFAGFYCSRANQLSSLRSDSVLRGRAGPILDRPHRIFWEEFRVLSRLEIPPPI